MKNCQGTSLHGWLRTCSQMLANHGHNRVVIERGPLALLKHSPDIGLGQLQNTIELKQILQDLLQQQFEANYGLVECNSHPVEITTEQAVIYRVEGFGGETQPIVSIDADLADEVVQ